jgi:hypothetical protein
MILFSSLHLPCCHHVEEEESSERRSPAELYVHAPRLKLTWCLPSSSAGATLVHTTSNARTQSGKLKVNKPTTGIGNSLGGSSSKAVPALSAPEPPPTLDYPLATDLQDPSPETIQGKPKRVRVVASVTIHCLSFAPSGT